jgi:cytochrome P450
MNKTGNVFSRSEFYKDPYAFYAALRAQGPVHHFDAGFWTLCRYKDVVEALERPDLFSSDTGVSKSTPPGEDPPLHTTLRKITSMLLSKQRLPNLEQRMRDFSLQLLDRLADQRQFELIGTLASELPFFAIGEILGIPVEKRYQCSDWLKQLKPFRELEQYLAEIPLRETAGQNLTYEQRVRLMHFILLSATETTRSLIGNATLALLKNVDQMQLVRSRRDLVPALIEESLRYEAPAPFRERRTTQDVWIEGNRIPAGSFVYLLIGSANRDSDAFPDPDQFLITRENSKQISFGEGPHYCLGAHLARMEGQIALDGLLFHLSHFEAVDSLEKVEYIQSFKIRGVASLHLAVEKK